MLQEIF